jgi:excisionase family DNA binding protein
VNLARRIDEGPGRQRRGPKLARERASGTRETVPSARKSKNVQIHASLSKDFAGSLLDGLATDDEALRSVGKLLTVRQVAKVHGVCPATVYGLCDGGELPHYRVRNAIRVDVMEIEAMLQRLRGKHPR